MFISKHNRMSYIKPSITDVTLTYSMLQGPSWEANWFAASQEIPRISRNRRFFTALTSVRHLSLSWASPVQSIYPHPTSWRSVLILSTHLRLGLPSGQTLLYVRKYIISGLTQFWWSSLCRGSVVSADLSHACHWRCIDPFLYVQMCTVGWGLGCVVLGSIIFFF